MRPVKNSGGRANKNHVSKKTSPKARGIIERNGEDAGRRQEKSFSRASQDGRSKLTERQAEVLDRPLSHLTRNAKN